MIGYTSTGPCRSLLSMGYLTLVFGPEGLPQCHCPFDLASTALYTPRSLPSHFILSRPQEDVDCPQGALPPTELGHLWRPHPVGTPPQAVLPHQVLTRNFLFKP